MTKAERLLYLINLIRSNRTMTSKQLAERCGVSERTIFRDINSLASARFPIYYDRGYKFLEGSFLPTLNLTDEELLALRFAFEFSPAKSNSSVMHLGKNLQTKLEAGRKRLEADKLVRLNHSTTGELSSGNGAGEFLKMCQMLNTAIGQKRAVKIRCKGKENHSTDAVIEPYALLQRNLKWQVLCFCHVCKKMSSYDLTKIENVFPTSDLFQSKISLDELFTIHQ